jgi:tRNA (guanine-N7-)-methyltransferase
MLKSYALRTGRFTDAQKKAYASLSARFVIPFSEEVEKLDLRAVFGRDAGLTLEIGFGMGEATVIIAEANPGKDYLGVEVFQPGVGRLLWEMEKRQVSNIRIIEHDAAAAAEKMIPDDSLEAVHLFFPDPWPKKRHNKRRLVQRPFTETLARKLKSGGFLYMVTDWEDYALHALSELSATPQLRNEYEGFAPPAPWRPKTKFEQKGILAGRAIYELYFVKKSYPEPH